MLSHDNPWRSDYIDNQPQTTWIDRLRRWLPLPDDRLWTRRSIRTLEGALKEVQPDAPDRVVVNLGAGPEKVYRRLFQPYRTLLRLGLPHAGTVDGYADAHALPCQNSSVDLFISSSVIEHLQDPERAVAEMKRVIRPGGMIYVEVPFIVAHHMAPVDYQRYTIRGLETLFARHGFKLKEVGICSGPFTAAALLFLYFMIAIAPKGSKMVVRTLLSWLVQPLKYLDRLCENAEWATYHACNFYYLGRKPEGTTR